MPHQSSRRLALRWRLALTGTTILSVCSLTPSCSIARPVDRHSPGNTPSHYLAAAFDGCKKIEIPSRRDMAFLDLGRLQVQTGDFEGARTTIQVMKKDEAGLSPEVWRSLARELAIRGRASEALASARAEDRYTSSVIASEVARVFAENGDIPAAVALTENMYHEIEKVSALASIAAARYRSGDHVRSKADFERARSIIKEWLFVSSQLEGYGSVAVQQARLGNIQDALDTCAAMPDVPWDRPSSGPGTLLAHVCDARPEDKALRKRTTEMILSDPKFKNDTSAFDWALNQRIADVVECGELDAAMALMPSFIVSGDRLQVVAATTIAKAFVTKKDLVRAKQACLLADTFQRDQQVAALVELGCVLFDQGDRIGAVELLQSTARDVDQLDDLWKPQAHEYLAAGYARVADWKRATAMLARIPAADYGRALAGREVAREWAAANDAAELDAWLSSLTAPTEIAYANLGAAEGRRRRQRDR